VSDPREMLSCREVVELVTSYLEGALTEAEEVRFEQHLATCDGCTAYLDQMRRTIALVGRLDPAAVDPEVRDRLVLAFRGWSRGTTRPTME
jgi:anti-sigma factor RsiW